MAVSFATISLSLCFVELLFPELRGIDVFWIEILGLFVCFVWVFFSERGDIISVPKVALGCGWARFYFPTLFCGLCPRASRFEDLG